MLLLILRLYTSVHWDFPLILFFYFVFCCYFFVLTNEVVGKCLLVFCTDQWGRWKVSTHVLESNSIAAPFVLLCVYPCISILQQALLLGPDFLHFHTCLQTFSFNKFGVHENYSGSLINTFVSYYRPWNTWAFAFVQICPIQQSPFLQLLVTKFFYTIAKIDGNVKSAFLKTEHIYKRIN